MSIGGLKTSNPFRSISSVAEQLGVTTKTIRRWIDDKKLNAHKLGGVWRIADRDLMEFLNRGRRA